MNDLNATGFLHCGELDRLGPGLTVELVHDAIRDGEAAANSCTENDPAILPGFLRWGRTMRGLRDRLAPYGWRRGVLKGMPTVVSPDGKTAITVATGSEGTGTESDAKTKYRKGAAAISAVATNQLMFAGDLFGASFAEEEEDVSADRVTWYLLIAKIGDEIRAEVSLPSGIGADGRVEGLTNRYLLPPLSLKDTPTTPANDEPDVVVDVERR